MTSDQQPPWDEADEEQCRRLMEFERLLRAESASETLSVSEDPSEELNPLLRCLGLLEGYRRSQSTNEPTRNMSINVPREFGHFRIIRQLGQGASGVVFLANDTRLERQLALKILRPESVFFIELRDRFFREARAAARMRHPHIAEIFDVGQYHSIAYIASAYYDGPTLATWMDQHGPVSATVAAEIARQLALAAQHAHARGILHRDIKPTNVLLESAPTPSSAENKGSAAVHVRLTDFGLARFVDESSPELTRHNTPIGTAAYMAPEQAACRVDDIGVHSDVWSLGVVLHELLTGHAVVEGATSSDIMRRIERGEYRPFAKPVAPVTRDMRAICEKCLAMDYARPTGDLLFVGSQKGPIARVTINEDGQLHEAGELSGHSSNVYQLVFSPDGRTLASASKDGMVRVWNVANRSSREILAGHQARVYGVGFSHDGGELVSCSKDGTLRRWRTVSSRFEERRLRVRGIGSFTSNAGRGLLNHYYWGKIFRVDLNGATTEALPYSLEGEQPDVSSDGRWIALVGSLCVPKLESRVPKILNADLDGDAVADRVAFLDGRRNCCVWQPGRDGLFDKPAIWDVPSSSCAATGADSSRQVFFSYQGVLYRSGSEKPIARERYPGANLLTTLPSSSNSRFDLIAFDPGRSRLLRFAAAGDKYRPVSQLRMTSEPTLGATLPLDGANRPCVVVYVPDTAAMLFWEVTKDGFHLLREIDAPMADATVLQAVRLPGEDTGLLLGNRTEIHLLRDPWRDDRWQRIEKLDQLPLTTRPAANVIVLDAETMQVVAALHARATKVNACVFSPDNRSLATAGSDGTLRVWNWRDGFLTSTIALPDPIQTTAISFDRVGRLVCYGIHDDVWVWDLVANQVRFHLRGHDNTIGRLACSPKQDMLVSTSHDLTVRMWDLNSGGNLAVLTGHTQRPVAASFSSDGRLLVTGGEQGELRLWDVTTRQPLFTFDFPCEELRWVGFLGPRKLVAVGADISTRETTIGTWRAE